MPQAIGLRLYKLFFSLKGSNETIDRDDLAFDDLDLVRRFVARHASRAQPDENERSWYFETPQKDEQGHVTGLVQYGTSGFASKLLDIKTNMKKYDRVETDVEQIPLFFDFWLPPNGKFLMISLQSFGQRSCVDLVQSALRVFSEQDQQDHRIRFKKIMPNDRDNPLLQEQPVKNLTFVASKASSDVAESLIPFKPEEPVDLSIMLRARRRRGLGSLKNVLSRIEHREGAYIYEGVGFTQAYAEISLGRKKRKIGIFGAASDTGTIDITDDVSFENGHPTFKSLSQQSDEVLAAFYNLIAE